MVGRRYWKRDVISAPRAFAQQYVMRRVASSGSLEFDVYQENENHQSELQTPILTKVNRWAGKQWTSSHQLGPCGLQGQA
jgi:hypothetical protein